MADRKKSGRKPALITGIHLALNEATKAAAKAVGVAELARRLGINQPALRAALNTPGSDLTRKAMIAAAAGVRFSLTLEIHPPEAKGKVRETMNHNGFQSLAEHFHPALAEHKIAATTPEPAPQEANDGKG
jgi:hypothetical protein